MLHTLHSFNPFYLHVQFYFGFNSSYVAIFTHAIQNLLDQTKVVHKPNAVVVESCLLGASGLEVGDKILTILFLLESSEHHLGTLFIIKQSKKNPRKE